MSPSSSSLAGNWPVASWFKTLPLYTAVDIGSNSSSAVKAILIATVSVDFYCPACKKESTFQGILSPDTQNSVASEMMAIKSFGIASGFWKQTIFSKQLACARAGHKATFYFQVEEGKLLKVGQYPSIADIHYGEMLDYASALGQLRVREMNNAIELAAEGKGLAAIGYLKRIIDSLLDDICQHSPQLDKNLYDEAAYPQKLSLINSHAAGVIPEFLLKNPEFYAVLDTDPATLSEEQCMQQFEQLKLTAFFLMDQNVAVARMQKLIEEANAGDTL